MKKNFFISVLISLFFLNFSSHAQFAPAAGIIGTTAIYKDSSVFKSWATNCIVFRGLQNISLPSLGYTNTGDSLSAIGIPGSGVVSLGDGGSAILQFSSPIIDGIGPDFAVFENSFDGQFLELAFVEVSSDGIHFFRFPAVSNSDTTIQTGSFGLTNPTKINNLAGKYKAEYGTPFDLNDLPNNSLLDKQSIKYVKIIDVVGCIQNQYCTRDSNHHKINDPWPTAFSGGGFDLDAIGVIHQQPTGVNNYELNQLSLFQNPASNEIQLNIGNNINSYSVVLTNILGQKINEWSNQHNYTNVSLADLSEGTYVFTIFFDNKQTQIKFIKL